MKKIITIIFGICLIFMASCRNERFYGEAGVVQSVRYAYTKEYKYEVYVSQSNIHGGYRLRTNHLYQVGDTIYILGKNYR